jgi:hypothetical protein
MARFKIVSRHDLLIVLPLVAFGCGLPDAGLTAAGDSGGDGRGVVTRDAASRGHASGGDGAVSGESAAPGADAARDARRLVDATSADSSRVDSHVADSSKGDSRQVDSHVVDSHVVDSHVVDSHVVDSHTSDSRAHDARAHDAGHDAHTVSYPTTCPQDDAGSAPQTTTLYVGGDPNQPWTAVCAGGDAYLPLGSTTNVSSYPPGNCATIGPGQSAGVTTTWTMLRIDPTTLMVDTADFTGATSSGATSEVSGDGSFQHEYTSMPYGATRSCVDQAPTSAGATIDLSDTHFAVASTQTWYPQGWSNTNKKNAPYGGAAPASGKTISLSVGGYPAGISPCNDYYQTMGGQCLQLVYSP